MAETSGEGSQPARITAPIIGADRITELSAEWEGAGRMRLRMMRHVRGAIARLPQPGLAHAVYNLPLLLACDVLRQVLKQTCVEHGIRAPNNLGPLLEATEKRLHWLNFAAICAAKDRRNAIAHEGAQKRGA